MPAVCAVMSKPVGEGGGISRIEGTIEFEGGGGDGDGCVGTPGVALVRLVDTETAETDVTDVAEGVVVAVVDVVVLPVGVAELTVLPAGDGVADDDCVDETVVLVEEKEAEVDGNVGVTDEAEVWVGKVGVAVDTVGVGSVGETEVLGAFKTLIWPDMPE